MERGRQSRTRTSSGVDFSRAKSSLGVRVGECEAGAVRGGGGEREGKGRRKAREGGREGGGEKGRREGGRELKF